VAAGLSAVLGANKRENGFFIGNSYIVSYCFGHLLELAAPDAYGEQYKKWNYTDLPIIPDKWKHVPTKDKAAQLKILKDLLNRADVEYVVNACDAGREGELIFRLVYESAKSKLLIKRLWIQSMEDAAIQAGFANLQDGAAYDTLYHAAACREQADWIVGISATRLFSVNYGTLLNVGRVQSPTLAMLVKREADIAGFVKEPFYTPTLDLSGFTVSGEKLKDKETAEAIRAACDGQSAVVTSVERVTKTAAPPKLYDLTTLQREANRLFGYTAQQTLDCAQSLYEKAYITYPRTDSRFLTSDMAAGLPLLVNKIALMLPSVKVPLAIDAGIVINDGKVSDHHAIIPTEATRKADLPALPSGERDILNLIAVRLITATAPKHVYEVVTATLDCGGNTFSAKGRTVIEDGWKAFDGAFRAILKTAPDSGEETDEDSDALPELSKGQTFDSVTVTVKEGATTPPKHLTEDTLLSSMETAGAEDMPDEAERKGLGTPATRAAIIEKLVKSGFAERSKKNLLPTDKAKNLIAVLPTALTSAKLTAGWESRLLDVQRGELPAKEFMDGIATFIKAIVLDNNAPKPELAALFPNDKKNAAAPLGLCSRCGSPVRESARGFFCDSRTCEFKIWKDSKWWKAKKNTFPFAAVK
jgi:DNA topoisomerase-3